MDLIKRLAVMDGQSETEDLEAWNTVVIWTPLVRQIMDADAQDHKLSLLTFMHELVHVEDQRVFDKTFPGGWPAAS